MSMPPIQCVVVLMLENRSFDHLFGTWPGVSGLSVVVNPTTQDEVHRFLLSTIQAFLDYRASTSGGNPPDGTAILRKL